MRTARRSTLLRGLCPAFAGVIAALLLLPAAVQASYPGVNGKIFYATGGDIHSVNPDGSGDVNLTNSPSTTDLFPAVSPDGTKVAFSRDSRIHTMNADGSGVAPLTPASGDYESEPSWSPDGTQVAYSSTASGLYDVWKIDSDGTGATQITFTTAGFQAFRPAWGPGNAIAYEASATYFGLRDIYRINPDGTGVVNVSGHPAYDGFPGWKSDGSQIYYTSYRTGNADIFSQAADGSGSATQITTDAGVDQDPQGSPDGTKVVYQHAGAIWTIDTDGTDATEVVAAGAFPDWQPIVDTTPPETTIDSGPSGPTMDQTPTFGFSADEAGSTFECRFDSDPWASCSSPLTSPVIGDGPHTFEVRATDTAGNTDPSPASRSFFVDTRAPTATITSDPGAATSDDTPEFGFTSSDPGPSSGIDRFECRVDGGSYAPCTSPHSTAALADGPHTFDVVVYDNAGNSSILNPDSHTFFVDTAGPDTIIITHPPAYSNDTNPVFEFTFSDPPPSSGFDRFECRLDGGAWSSCSSGDSFATPEGNHTFEVRGVDNAGNADATPASHSWMVDTTDPVITLNGPLNKDRFLLHAADPSDYRCDDPLSGGPPPVASGFAPSGATSTTGGPGCSDNGFNNEDLGPHYFIVTATDRAGNTSTEKVAYTIDPPDYGEFVKADRPLAYYRLGEPLGSDEMLDSSANHHDGTYQNGVALQRDGATACERRPHPPRACELANPAENRAAYFPPRDGHGYVNGITAPTGAYTMEAWVKPADGANMMILSHGGGGQLFISGGKLAFRQTQDTVYGGGPTLAPGKWWHVAATWNGSRTRLFVNGSQIASSTSANKPPSGTATFYVGYGEMAPWFHGHMDEAAYYRKALSPHAIRDRHKVGTAYDHPSLEAGNSPYNTEGPSTDPEAPKNNGIYAPTKVPDADFGCDDPDGPSDVDSCTATVDGNPIASGDPLPDGIGTHTFVVTAVDKGGNTYVHTHTYEVLGFADLHRKDGPVAYYRLGEGTGPGTQPMNDSSGNHNDGEYKNGTESGPIGISGDGDRARRFTGADGYGYANGIQAPRFQSSLVAWVNADSTADGSITGHGDAGELFVKGGTFRYRRMDTTVDSHIAPDPGHFQQIVGTWDGVEIAIYVDGVLANRTESTRRPSSSSTFYVGYGELAPWFAGVIDEVAYYPIGLTPARVYQLWLADPPADPAAGPNPPQDPADPPEDPIDPAKPTKPSKAPSAAVDPPTGSAAACDAAEARLAKANRKLGKARQAVRKARRSQSRKKLKKAKRKLERARSAVAEARASIAESC